MQEFEQLKKCDVVVFGLAGQVGSGPSFVRDKLQQILKTYGYEVNIADVSQLVLDAAYKILYPDASDLTVMNDYDRVVAPNLESKVALPK
jgi:hypothetical protein